MKKTIFKTTIAILCLSSVIWLSGCKKNASSDVVKLTAETQSDTHLKDGKTISLSTAAKLIKKGDLNAAVQFLEEYKEFYQKNPKYYYYLGQAYYDSKNYQKAVENYQTALALDGNRSDILLNLGYAYQKADNKEDGKKKSAESFVRYVFETGNTEKFTEIRNELNRMATSSLGREIIGRVAISDSAEIKNNSLTGIKQAFVPETPLIYASVEVINAEKPSKIRIKWEFEKALLSKKGRKDEAVEVNSAEFTAKDSRIFLFSVKMPITGWIEGKYTMRVFVDETENTSVIFYVF